MIITKPGVYDIATDLYHADPCDTPSCSAGMITDILEAPAKCFNNSKRLNPEYEDDEGPEKFTIGTVSHVLFLEPHLFDEKVVIVEADDWRKNETKEKRTAAKTANKTAILAKHMNMIYAARKAFNGCEFVKGAFSGGKTEQSMFWRHPAYGFWCRARPDFLHDSWSHICDYKATNNANPSELGRHFFDLGYHRRASWYLEGAKALHGEAPKHYWFVCQENKAPYLPVIAELDHNSLEAGQQQNDHGSMIFARCLEKGQWPGYRHLAYPEKDMAFQIRIPNYAYIKIDERNYM